MTELKYNVRKTINRFDFYYFQNLTIDLSTNGYFSLKDTSNFEAGYIFLFLTCPIITWDIVGEHKPFVYSSVISGHPLTHTGETCGGTLLPTSVGIKSASYTSCHHLSLRVAQSSSNSFVWHRKPCSPTTILLRVIDQGLDFICMWRSVLVKNIHSEYFRTFGQFRICGNPSPVCQLGPGKYQVP